MKKTIWVILFTLCGAFLNLNNAKAQDPVADRINLGRLGGTTRSASTMSRMLSARPSSEPVIDVFNSGNVISISVQNYRGGVWVEIIGQKDVKQSYIEVSDMGFEVVSLAGLRPGKYTLRVTIGSNVYTGTFKKNAYERK